MAAEAEDRRQNAARSANQWDSCFAQICFFCSTCFFFVFCSNPKTVVSGMSQIRHPGLIWVLKMGPKYFLKTHREAAAEWSWVERTLFHLRGPLPWTFIKPLPSSYMETHQWRKEFQFDLVRLDTLLGINQVCNWHVAIPLCSKWAWHNPRQTLCNV